jgi:flagellar motor switch protein FliG
MAIKLTGSQKAAIFMKSLNPKTAKQLMGKLGIQEKNIIRKSMSQINKAGTPIYLKMWETFKHDVDESPTCETPWPNKTNPQKQAPIPEQAPKPAE